MKTLLIVLICFAVLFVLEHFWFKATAAVWAVEDDQ